REAVDAARVSLWFMISRLNINDEKNPAEAEFYHALNLVTRILNDTDADKLVAKYAPAPGARDKILSALQQGRPPLRPKAARRANELRDRWLADILERIRRRGFPPTSGDATKDNPNRTRHSACSILAKASRELETVVHENPEQWRASLIEEEHFTPLLA